MGQFVPEFAQEIEKFLRGHGAFKVTFGRAEFYEGRRRKVKLSNGKPGQLRVDVCEPGGKVALFAATGNCRKLAEKVSDYCRSQKGIAVQGL